jgi:hypothetical protein
MSTLPRSLSAFLKFTEHSFREIVFWIRNQHNRLIRPLHSHCWFSENVKGFFFAILNGHQSSCWDIIFQLACPLHYLQGSLSCCKWPDFQTRQWILCLYFSVPTVFFLILSRHIPLYLFISLSFGFKYLDFYCFNSCLTDSFLLIGLHKSFYPFYFQFYYYTFWTMRQGRLFDQ